MESNSENLKILRHSAAHLLAHAVQRLFPNTKCTIGPATDDGFFYDLLPEKNFTLDDLPSIQKMMQVISDENHPIVHAQISKSVAREMYADNPFKLELIDGIQEDTVGIAVQGDFTDLCRGGHVENTGQIKHFALLTTSGSYWRGDQKNQALQRIYGTAFFSNEDLEQYLQRREQAQLYDHRKLGKELDLFSFHEEGPGFPFFHPNGIKILTTLKSYLRGLLNVAHYDEVETPMMLSDQLWRQSGHYAHYKENMYFCHIDTRDFAIKPMNCPGAFLIYADRPHSYRELPLRYAEFGKVHRHELSGVLHGLMRVRAFTQDDAHIFCTREQIEQEVLSIVTMTLQLFAKFGFEKISINVSTRPENSLGSDELWDIAISSLKNALQKSGQTFGINEGDGAFYGPKIDFGIEDSMGRNWQCGTIQLDFFQPENFDLTYVSAEGKKERPVIIHRAIFGSFERFLGIIIEHYKGKFPFWLAPLQIRVLTITDDQKEYAHSLVVQLHRRGIRIELEESSDPISGKIKSAQLARVAWMFVIGKKEVANNTVTLRYADGTQEFGLSLDDIIKKVEKELE